MKQIHILKAVPSAIGWNAVPPGSIWDVTDLPHDKKQEVRKELEAQGFFVQDWYPVDPTELLMRARIRKEVEEENGPLV